MKRPTVTFFLLFLTIICCVISFLFSEAEAEEYAQEADFLVTINVDMSSHPDGVPISLWLPYPVSTPFQDVTNVAITGNFATHGIYSEPLFNNMILFASWPANMKQRVLKMSFRVKRQERNDTWMLKAKEGCLDRAYVGNFLRDSSVAPLSPAVVDLSHQITNGKKTTLQKAKAIYEWVCNNLKRDPNVKGCGCGDVCFVLERKVGKCADIHSVFVALLKGAGVPAREVFGLRLPSSGQKDVTNWQHCWAEFYVPNVGWLVADPGDYLKALLEKKLSPSSPEAKRLKKYFFGHVDPFRVRLSIGRDLILNPPQDSEPLNYFMYPYAEVKGQPVDYLDYSNFTYSISATRLR